MLEFYEARKAEEQLERNARSLAYETGMKLWKEEKLLEKKTRSLLAPEVLASMPDVKTVPDYFFGRPHSEHFMKLERKELSEGVGHRKSLLQFLDAAKAATEEGNRKSQIPR